MHHVEPAKAAPIGSLPVPFDLTERSAGIRWAVALTGTGFWLISDYKMARQVLADPRFSRSEASGQKAPKIMVYNAVPDSIISLEGAAHTRIRELVAPAFTERRIAQLEPFVARSVEDLLDELEAQEAPADFVSHVSSPLPFGVLCHLLGVPSADREVFGSWVNVLFRLEGDRADSRQHSVGLVRYMMRLIADKRREPTDDLISALIRSSGRRKSGEITNRELVNLCLSLLMAGFDSTADQITLCVFMAFLDRALVETLRHNPELVGRATEELLRLNPAPYMTFPRMAVEPVSIGGTVIQPGQLVVVFTMGANRDPAAFTPGDEIALDQPGSAHLTFGHGLHRCLGAPLARLQLTTLLAALLRRFPDLQVAEDLSSLDWKSGMATRGLKKLHVSW
jgi:cytochrome P450